MDPSSKLIPSGRRNNGPSTFGARGPYPYPRDWRVKEWVPDKLQLRNLVEWTKQMHDFIAYNGLLGFIDGAARCPTEIQSVTTRNGGTNIGEQAENKQFVAWKKSDDTVREWIYSRLTYGIKTKVEALDLETAEEVWKALPQLVEDIKKELNHYLPLYKAAIEGNWDSAEEFIRKEPHAVRASITHDSETALIVAVRAVRRNDFVKKLVVLMSPEDLAIGDIMGRTALHRAAGSGNIKAAKLLVEEDKQKRKEQKRKELMLVEAEVPVEQENYSNLPNLETKYKQTPLYYAAARGDSEMILWLMDVMKTKRLEGEPGFKILHQLTISKLYDIALKVLRDNPELAFFIPDKEEDLKFHPLIALAGNPSSFPSGSNFNFLQRFIYCRMKLENIPDHSRSHIEAPHASNVVAADSRSDIEAPPASNNFGAANGGWGCAVKKRSHAMFWKVTASFVPLIKPIREKKRLHDQALDLLQLLCEEVIKSDFSNADRIFQLPLQQATSLGIPEIVEKILELYPYAVSLENRQKQSIFKQAIVFRQEKVFNLIHQLEESREIVLSKWDADGNNALHLAGYVANPQLVYVRAGAAFQMQRELLWFKEVERLALPKNKEDRNKKEMTPAQVFSDSHKGLVKEGKRWMKDTATSCTIIASLVATVVFAAAIQVPGGLNPNGRPIFYQRNAFTIFGISNGLALFSSTASVVMFLSVLTSSYEEEDFLFALPNKLIIGLISLFVAILFMMAAFGATLYLLFAENKRWILIPLVVLGCLPVISFGGSQFPLLVKMFQSTYCSSTFVKQSKRMLL